MQRKQIINSDNTGNNMKCDVCGSEQKGHQMEECFIRGIQHQGYGIGQAIVCHKCYHIYYRTNAYGYPEMRRGK